MILTEMQIAARKDQRRRENTRRARDLLLDFADKNRAALTPRRRFPLVPIPVAPVHVRLGDT